MITKYEAGSTMKELGAQFGISRSKASSILKDHEVKIRNQSLILDSIARTIKLYNT